MVDTKIKIENADINYRNFSGKKGDYNDEGDRNFCVFLEQELGIQLKEEGWNIKFTRPTDEDETPKPFLSVTVAFGNYPPRIMLVTSRNQTRLNERTIHQLDTSEILNVDVSIRPYNWEHRGKTGVKAYVQTLYVTVAEDDFAHKYYDIPENSYNYEPSEDDLNCDDD